MVEKIATANEPVGPRMGEGDFPPELDHLNWSTVLWGGLWPLVYGAWTWVLGLLALVTIGVALAWYVPRLTDGSPAVSLTMSVSYRIAFYAVIIALAYRANRHVWDKERRRLVRESDQSVPRPSALVATYEASQRKWARIGLAFLVLQTLCNLWNAWDSPLFIQGVVGDIVVVVILVGLYLYERTRGRVAQG